MFALAHTALRSNNFVIKKKKKKKMTKKRVAKINNHEKVI